MDKYLFPSPVGDLIYIQKLFEKMRTAVNVSVPCRGLNLYTSILQWTRSETCVSVPCRGLNLYTSC